MIAGVGHGVALGSYLDSANPNIPLPWLEGVFLPFFSKPADQKHRQLASHKVPSPLVLHSFQTSAVDISKWLLLAAGRTLLGLGVLMLTRSAPVLKR